MIFNPVISGGGDGIKMEVMLLETYASNLVFHLGTMKVDEITNVFLEGGIYYGQDYNELLTPRYDNQHSYSESDTSLWVDERTGETEEWQLVKVDYDSLQLVSTEGRDLPLGAPRYIQATFIADPNNSSKIFAEVE